LNAASPSNPNKGGKAQAQPAITIVPPPTPSVSSPTPKASISAELVKTGGLMLDLSKEAVQKATSNSTFTIDSLESSFHRPQGNQPSPYLQNICPLCFNVTLDKLKEILKGVPDAEL
jgi:hypothetical protein